MLAFLDRSLGKSWARHLYRISAVLGFSLLFSLTNLFGAQDAMNDAVHDFAMWGRFGRTGFLDPGREPDATKQAVVEYLRGNKAERPYDRPQGATVVLWTDKSMNYATEQGYSDSAWPISYEAHAELLYEVASLGAKAIFVDFVFLTKRKNDPSFPLLIDAIQFVHDEGIPLFFASDPSTADEPAFLDFRDKIKSIREKDPSGILGFAPASVMSDPVVRAYCLAVEYGNEAQTPDHRRILYSQSSGCAEPPADFSITRREGAGYTIAPLLYDASGYRGEADFSGRPEPMFLYWDRGEHLVTRQEFGICRNGSANCDPCLGEADNSTGFFTWIPAILFDPSILQRRAAGPPLVPAHYLLEGERVCGGDAIEPLDLIEGRIVLIGSGQSASGDARNTPNSTEVPGIMIHASAVENLIRFKDHYVYDKLIFERITLSQLVQYSVLFVMAALYSLAIEYVIREQGGRGNSDGDRGKVSGLEILRRENDLTYIRKVAIAFLVSFVPVVFALGILLGFRAPPGAWAYSVVGMIALSPPWVLLTTRLTLCVAGVWEWMRR
ncbi:CHASE2 domain-containing protein [Nisaea denitrificans]|uniref:CHASE2 domain-containing protein n=1 Tax=Nisaea denitrificans TaxID=390877 RepID=UPI00042563CB|nr:CHASE2 domain-containing protein [Nisaea denitrificans]